MTVAVVTGAGRGLGRLVAQRLAGRGHLVLCTDVDAEAAAETAQGIGERAWAMAHDVRDPEAHRAVARAASARGTLGIWVNNAGVLRSDTAWGHPDSDVKLTVEVNLLGVMYGCRAAVDAMRASGGGHVINICSMSALVPTPGVAVYGATKWGVLGYSLSLQGDLDRAGIPVKVSAICPDAFDTELVRAVQGKKDAALLFSRSSHLYPAETVADLVVGVLDRYQAVVIFPKSRGLLARLFAPFPELQLRMLGAFWKLGERNRRRAEAG